MATITKESIKEAAKLSNISVNEYIDKLPNSYLQEASKLSNMDISTYKTKLKEVWGEGLKKKDDTSNVGSGSGALESGKSQSTSQSPKSSKPIIGTIQAQSNESPYIKVGINKPSVSTSKETKIVENEKKPIIGTKEAQQQKSIVSVDIPIKPLPTEEERDKALDKAKAEIELVKITNNFGNKKEDGTDDIAKNVTDYYDTSIRQTAVNDLSKPDQLILQLSESVKAIKNEQELIGQQYNSGKISENTYNTLNKNLEKNRTELELKTTGLISERNRDIDNEIKALKQVLLKGERPFDMGKDIDWKKDGGFTEFQNNPNTSPKKLSEDEKAGIKKQITILEKQKGNISENLKMQDNEIESLQGTLQESERQGLIPKGATLEQALKIQYAKNDQTLKMLKEQSAKEGNPFVSSTSGMWDNAKEFVGDIIGAGTLKEGENPYLTAKNKSEHTPGYKNIARQYLIEDKTANKIYELKEQQKALSTIIELDRYGNYKKDSGFTNFTKQFTQTMIPTVKGKILTQSEIASATQKILNEAGITEVEDVTGKVLNDNKHNVSDMLATTVAFGIQFALTPNILGKFAMLGKLGMKYKNIRKLAETIEKGIKYTEKSRLGRLFGQMAKTGLEYQGKGLVNAQLAGEADFGSGAFGVLGEKVLTKMFPFGSGKWVSGIGRGWGELGEETGQQIWQTYRENGKHIDKSVEALKQQFPEMKDVQMFVFGTALMGMGFGLGSKSTGNEKKISQSFGEWREKQIKKLLDEGKITQGELNKVNGIINDLTAEHTNAINQELKDGVSITEEEKSELIKNSKNVTEVKGKDGKITTTITNENGEQIAIKDNKLYILYEETTSEYTANADGSVMHGARVIDNPNGLTEIELIKQDIESRKQQELIKADENGADKNEIEQRYNNELDNLEKNSIGSVQEQASTQTDSNSNKRDLQEQASTTPKDTQEITYSYNGETYIEDNKGNLTKEDHSLVPIDQQQEIKNNGQKIINVKAPEITAEIESTADADIPDFSHIQQNSNIEAKKADIERRRQEELKQVKSLEQTPEQLIRNTKIAEQRLRDAEEIFSFGNTYSDALDNIMLKQKKLNEILRKREKEETKNRDFHQWEKEELEKQPEYQENKRLDKIITLINEVYTEGKSENFNNSTKEAVDYEQNELNNVSSKKYRNTEEIRKINAKYDAELKELENNNPTLPTNETEQTTVAGEQSVSTDVEAKKADIERRRQEEISNQIEDAINIRNSKTKDELDKSLMKAFQEETPIKALNTAGMMLGKDITVKYYNKDYSFKNEVADAIESTQKNQISKINAKYDAELDALEQPIQSEIEVQKADIKRRRQEELDSVSKVINQDDKKILEDNINKRFDLELQKINKENETTSTQPTDTGKKQNNGKGVQESQPNNNGVGTGNVQPIQTQTEQQRERKVIQADIKAVNNAIAELEGKKGVVAKANLEKQKAKLAELNKELADTEESNTTKNTTTTHPTKSSTKKETPKNNLQHSLNFDNLDEKLAQDEAEHRHAESKLTTEDNIEQEPNVKIVESTAGNKGGTSTKKLADTDKSATELKDNATGVQLKPLSEIHTDEGRFQERFKLNEQIVNNIAEKFSYADQDPIHVWTDPKDGKTYVLSGHHRYYGAKKAGIINVKIQDRTGDFTEAQAIEFATEEANANRSMGTPLERANTLRKKRKKGDSKEAIQKFLNKEGKNKNYVENLSHLNPDGKTITSLISLEESSDKVTQKESEKIADWIGEARKQNKNLTDQHENELFDFLMNKNSSKRITTKAELISKIASITGTLDFDPSKPLNIERYKYKSEGEKQYDKEVEERKDKISELQQKINDINDRFKNPNNPNYVSTDHKDYDSIKAQADKVIADTNVQLKAEQKALQELYQQKGKYTNAGSNQSALFQKGESNTETTPEQKKEAKSIIKFLSDKFKGLFVSDQKAFDDKIKSLGINSSSLVFMAENSHKVKQLAIINKTNPAPNNYNTWVRSEKDILTAEEAFKVAFEEGEMYPDFTVEDMQEALYNGEVTVYSSYPIKDGVFVTPSFMNAESYAGRGKVYSKKVKLDAIAWIDEGEGQMANVQFLKDKNGTVFGLYDPTENKIYLNERNLNPKTVWHEATHFQQAILKAMAQNGNKEAKKILTQFDKLLKPFVEQLLLGRTTVTIDGQRIPLQADVYKKGANEKTKAYKERMQDELWAFLQQEENHKLWQKNDTPFKRAVNKFKEAVTNLFKSILDIPKHKDISNMTLSELVGHTAKQLQDGRLEDSRNGEKGEVRMMTMPDGTKRQVKVLPEVTNGFYSPIEKKLLDEKAENLSATKWLERLGKGDEMQFTGLKEFLESKKPNEQVKKSELQAFMKDNRIEVVEVVKGGDASEAEIDTFLEDEMGQDMTREEAMEYLSNDETNEQTKYGQYQLNGEKENYKEVLVTMPSRTPNYTPITELPSGYDITFDSRNNTYAVIEENQTSGKSITGRYHNTKEDAVKNAIEVINAQRKNVITGKAFDNQFKSSHFDEPNILVHLRMNSRTDAEGNKVLFLEEVQSDWGQTGKKDGFKTSENVWDTQLGKDAVAAIKDMDNLGFDSWQQAATAISKSKDPLNDFDIIYKHKDLILKWRDAVNQERKTSTAPFVTDTNAWTKLGLKVALKEAVAQGADKIAWTTGEQQNERYDLSKQVDDVWVSQKDEWWSQQDRNYIKGKDVEITLKGGGVNKFSVNENGEIVSGDFKGQKLEAVIGKEMAEKILSATEETNFGEQDLQVGGSGMKGFYGSPTENKLGIVGNVAKKLFGQEPTTIKLKDGTEQHAVTITPEMRETVQEGQPLFMAGKEDPTPITLVSDKKSNNDIRFQILGEKGAAALDKYDEATHRMDNLSVARQMESADKTPKEIRLATGWERGADGLWRYEILDGEIKKDSLKELEKNQFLSNKDVNIGLVTYRKNDNGTYELSMMEKGAKNTNQFVLYSNLSEPELVSIIDNKEVSDKVLSGEGSESIIGANLDDAKEIKTDFTTFITGASPLNEVFKSKELFTAYPELKDVVVVVDKNEGLGASYSIRDGQKVITVGNVTNRTKSSLIHEIQHAIQAIEGFAKGGNPSQFNDVKNIDNLGLYDVFDKIKSAKPKSVDEVKSLKTKILGDNPYIYESDNWNRVVRKIENGSVSLTDIIKTPYEQYHSLAGEVEARNVQSRMNMTPEQRMETLLSETEDVAREDQIVMMDGVEQAMSLSETKPITQTQSKTLIDRLNKAFGGKVRLFSDWSRFIEQNKAVRFSVNKNYIGEALYIINKNAKKLRDLKRDLYNFQKYGDVTSGLAERAGVSEFNFSEEKNSLVVYEENGKAYYDIKDIEDAIKNQEREVSFIENNDNYDEDELDFEKSYLNNLESIKETFENNIEKIKGVYMSDLSDELNRLYEFKGKVISKIGGKAIGAHVFPKGDVRELYKIGDFVFHGEDVSDDYTKEEILKLDKLGEISSDIKIDNIKSLEDAISEIEKKLGIQFMQLPDGTIYGAVLPDGSMYLNPEKLNANTPIHEHTHLFNQVIQQTNPKLWNRMVEAAKGIGLWNEVKNDPNYKNLKTDSQIADEVYSRLTGNKGEVNWQERIAKADSKSRLAKVGELIKEYWNNVMDILGIKKMSADDFANMTLDKLFSGKEIKGAKEVLEAGNNLNNQIKSATDNVGTFSNESNDIRFSISNDGGQNLSDAEREEIRADLKMGLKLGNTIDELREMYAGTDEINISENDFSDLMSEAQKEFETEKSGKATKIDDDTEKDNDIQDTPKENKKDNRKKTYEWHRVHEGKFPKELIENLEKYDLDHEVENQELAEKRALAIIDNFGIENALKAVEKGYITGAEKAVVFSKAVEAIQAEIQLEMDPEIREKLAEDLGDIIRKTGDEMRDAGRFSAMWARIYKNSPLGYNAEYYINKYKESNNGEISKEMEDKFRELEETIKEQNAKIIELEKKQEEEIDKQIVESIVNNPPNKKDSKDKKSIKEKTKQLADKFRKFKTKPFTLKDADGNDIIIKQNSIVNYNDIIEAGAKIIEEAGRLGESIEMAIRKAREYVVSELEKQDWYKKLSQRDKDAVNTQLLEHFSIENTIESEYKISKGLLYELTKAGIERKGKDNYTIDDLVDDVYDIYKEQYPDLEKRQIRDDISNYGKTIDLSEEEIDVKLRNLRRDGKMLSAYEDLLNGNLPKRSGLQRDELTPSQREMQKKINDELRKIPKSAEQLKNAWKSALDAIKRKYQNQIEDLEKQIAKRERIVKILNRTELDDKANNLKARVEELKAELDELVGKKEMSEESKLRLVESNLKKSIEKTQDKIDYINKNGVEPKTPKNKSVTSNKIEALKEELKLKKEQLKLISEEIGLVEKKRLEMAKKRVAKQIEDLKERIANGDFSKKKRKPLPYDNELNDAKREKLKAQKEFELALYQNELANRGKFEIAKDALFEALNIPKGMLATLDMSAPLRQGSMLMFSNPIIFAKSFLKMHGFAFNSSKFENAQLDIENHKDYVLMHESGLGLTSPDARLMAREELFMQRLPKMIPIFSQLHSGSERAYTGFLNQLRVNVFLSGVEKLKEAGLSFESNSKAFKDLAKYVNYATGRGDTTTSEGLNKVLNTVFFSPKMITSRIQMFMLAINPNTTPQVRTMAIKSLLSFATYIASVGALSMAVVGKTMLGSDDDDENFKNFINPIHTDFAKIRKGDYVYDVTAGYAPLIRTIARMGVMAKISASGKKTELNGKGFRGETGISELGNFFENKLSPLARVVYSMPFLTNKNPNSNKFKETWRDTPPDELIKDIAKSLFIPISVGDIYQNLTDEEIKWYQATTNITLGIYGVGINKYSNKPTPSKQNKMGGGNGFGGK